MLYLAYGSNLNLRMLKNRLGNIKIVGKYILKDYKLVCDKYLSVIKSKGSCVPCGVFDIDDNAEKLLDEYEDYPNLYHKEYIENQLIYIKNEITNQQPTKEYVNDCIQGYKDFNFDINIINKCFEDTRSK